MRILVVTTWFPTPGHPAVGAFVARDVAALAARHDVRVLHLASPGFAQGSDDDGPQVLDFPGMDPVRVRVRRLVTDLRRQWPHVAEGVFGADMDLSLVNWGPVTIWLDSDEL